MVVLVKLHTILQRSSPEGMVREISLELAEPSLLKEILRILEIPLKGDALILAVNGRVVDENCVLADGDVVSLMPALSGG